MTEPYHAYTRKQIDCCRIGCWEPLASRPRCAEFEIHTQRKGGGFGGPDPYSDTTYACEKHVGELLGWQPNATKPEEIYWQVVPLDVPQ